MTGDKGKIVREDQHGIGMYAKWFRLVEFKDEVVIFESDQDEWIRVAVFPFTDDPKNMKDNTSVWRAALHAYKKLISKGPRA